MQIKADVIVPADQDAEIVGRCVCAVLEHSGTTLHRLIVIDDLPLDSLGSSALEYLMHLGPVGNHLAKPGPSGLCRVLEPRDQRKSK